ncbi:MAG: EAL domain-containing protein [Magnetococcales bacterium]|nr:EAL domain-containing protein [Magnetococcales bacterium]
MTLAETLRTERYRVFLVALLPVVFILAAMLLVGQRIQTEIAATEKEIIGIEVIRQVQQAINLAQDIRGLWQLHVARGQESADAIFEKSEALKAQLVVLTDLPGVRILGVAGVAHEFADEVGRRVLDRPQLTTPFETFQSHTFAVTKGLELIGLIAANSHLRMDPVAESHFLATLLADYLPALAESTGRVRGLGGAVAGKESPAPADLLRLGEALGGLRRTLDELTRLQHLAAHGQTGSGSLTGCYSQNTESGVHPFLEAGRALAATPRYISPTEFYRLGSEAIQRSLVCYDQFSDRLGTMLAERITTSGRNRGAILGALLIGLLLMLYSFRNYHQLVQASRKSLAASEARSRALVESAVDGIIIINNKGTILAVNHALEDMFGYPKGFLIGKDVTILMPEPHATQHDTYIRAYLSSRVRKIIGTSREVEGVCRDGGVFPLELSVGFFQEEGETYFTGIMHDITARKQASKALRDAYAQLENRVRKRTQELQEANERLKDEIQERVRAQASLQLAGKVFENASEGIIITDNYANILDVNPAFSEITGFSREEAIGSDPSMGKSGRHDQPFYTEMWSRLLTEGSWKGEIWDRRKDGTVYPKWVSINAVRDMWGRTLNYVGIFSDITRIKATEQRLEQLAYYDPLTSLPNRMLFRDRLVHEIELGKRQGGKLAVFFIDLDRFKHVNDTLGHAAGDMLLVEIAARITGRVRKSDTVARLGGDEFTVILSNISKESQAASIATGIIQSLQEPVKLGTSEAYVGASIGIAIFPTDGTDFDTLTKNADLAMYRAKEGGRGAFRFFEATMDTDSNMRMKMELKLRRAVENGEFTMYYQPKFLVADRRIVGAEALVRWRDPEIGMVSPAQFIPLAEETGLIIPLGEWILNSVCHQTREWCDKGFDPKIAVNLSASQFMLDSIADVIHGILEKTGLPPVNLEIEVTESMVMVDLNKAIRTMALLREMELGITVDDFGTGYSSLSYLKRFPLRSLKIDQSFVRDLTEDSDDAAIVSAIISMAHNLELRVVAEGVETEEQFVFLQRHGCDEVQGYLLGRPMPAEQFEQLLVEHRQKSRQAVPPLLPEGSPANKGRKRVKAGGKKGIPAV